MEMVASWRHNNNHPNGKSRVNTVSSRRRWDKAPRWIQERVSSQALKTYLVLQQLTQGKPTRLPKRLLASRRGVSSKTIYNHLCELIAAKVVRAAYAKVSACRNAPNLYVLLDIDGGDLRWGMERNCTEKPLQTLKPKATAREALRVENHPPMVRRLFKIVGRLYRQRHKPRVESKGHEHRLRAARERTRTASQASLGTLDAWNRANGGLSWEERNPEEAAWLERELAKQGVKMEA